MKHWVREGERTAPGLNLVTDHDGLWPWFAFAWNNGNKITWCVAFTTWPPFVQVVKVPGALKW